MDKKNYPAQTNENALKQERSKPQDISNFLQKASLLNSEIQGRLIFGLDATMSRQPTWDMASQTQASMFAVAGKKTGLSVQLVYFRGYGECRASKWVADPKALAGLMTKIDCRGGITQLSKVLGHASKEHQKKRVSALVFIGDAMEEDIDILCNLAGKLGVQGVKTFMFQEGFDALTEKAFREIARLSRGAYMRFDSNAPKELEALLSAVASFASGGHKALEAQRGSAAKGLLEQLK